jgi:hypothetical protein
MVFCSNVGFRSGSGSVSGLKKVVGFYRFFQFFSISSKSFFFAFTDMLLCTRFVNINMAQQNINLNWLLTKGL